MCVTAYLKFCLSIFEVTATVRLVRFIHVEGELDFTGQTRAAGKQKMLAS